MSRIFPHFLVIGNIFLATVCATESARLTTPADVNSALRKVIEEHYPKAIVSLNQETFTAKANTMRFTLHRRYRDGSISEELYQQEGPRHDGFMLSVSYSKGRSGRPIGPGSRREPYWTIDLFEIYNEKSDSHLWVMYSFGSSVKPDFHKRVLSVLGQHLPKASENEVPPQPTRPPR